MNKAAMKPLLRAICLFWITTWISSSTFAQSPVQDSLQRLLNTHPQQDDRRAELLNRLAYLLHTSQPDQTLAYADEVIGFADKLKDPKNLSSAYSMKAIAYIIKSELKNAELWTKKSLEIDQRIGHKPGIASNTSNLGLIYYRQNKYPHALARFQEATQLFRETNNPSEIMIYLNMAAIYAETKNFRKAEEYIQVARSRNEKVSDLRLEGYALLNLGTIYTDEGAYPKGRRYLDSALVVNQQINDQGNIAKAYGNLGSSYAKTHDYKLSKDYYQQALVINTALGNSRSIAVNHCGIGENYLMLDSLPLAYHHLSLSSAISKQLNAIDIQRDVSQNLSRYFEKMVRFDSALYYHKQFLLFKDSLDNEANKKQLTRLELQYDFDLKEQEYIQQQAISKLQIKQLWLYGALFIVLLISLSGYLLNRSRIRSIRLRNDMREKALTQQAEKLLLQQQLSESELKAIRSQMNPHFIFNVLNSIESFVLENDAKSASTLIQRFAQLTRLVLENSTQSLVSADREWKAVQLYVELEASRFERSFVYRFTVSPSLNLAEILLPPMLIQPLAENAILHGLRPVTGYQPILNISITVEEDHLTIFVEDNGIGLTAAKTKKRISTVFKEKSMGLAGVKDRLTLLKSQYPQSHSSLTVAAIDAQGKTGTCARLTLPLIKVLLCLLATLGIIPIPPLFGQQINPLDSLRTELQNHHKADTARVKLLHNIAIEFNKIDFDSMQYYTHKAWALAKQLKWRKTYGTINNNFGLIWDARGKPDSSMPYYQYYYDQSARFKDTSSMILALINLAAAQQTAFRDTTAIRNYHQALRLSEKKQNYHALALIHNNIANIYFRLGNYTRATEYNLESIKASKKSPEKADLGNAYETRGIIEQMMGNIDTAQRSYLAALHIYQRIGLTLMEATVLSRIALTFNDLDKKLGYHLRAQRIFDSDFPKHQSAITNLGNIGGTYGQIAIYAWDTLSRTHPYENFPTDRSRLLDSATSYLERAIALSRETTDKDNESEFTNYLGQIQQYQGDYKNALENFLISHNLEDSLHSQESKNRIAELQAGFAFEKKEADLKLRQQAAEHQQKEFILYGILAVIVVLSLTGYLLNRSRIRGIRLRNEMREKELGQQAEALLLQQQLSESELKAIRSQMNPHFIFNVLNSIESYILENDAKSASRLVQQFAKLTRLVLENSTQALVSADREWMCVQLYTQLEATRFEHSFDYDFQISTGFNLTEIVLPPMLIQPLVENAILHGLRYLRSGRGILQVKAVLENEQLVLTVLDNGIGLTAAKTNTEKISYKKQSIGTVGIRERLAMLAIQYPHSQPSLTITEITVPGETGTCSRLVLPVIPASIQTPA